MEIVLNNRERRAVGRLLTERKALLIETTEDTTQPDPARRTALTELLREAIGFIRRPRKSVFRETGSKQ